MQLTPNLGGRAVCVCDVDSPVLVCFVPPRWRFSRARFAWHLFRVMLCRCIPRNPLFGGHPPVGHSDRETALPGAAASVWFRFSMCFQTFFSFYALLLIWDLIHPTVPLESLLACIAPHRTGISHDGQRLHFSPPIVRNLEIAALWRRTVLADAQLMYARAVRCAPNKNRPHFRQVRKTLVSQRCNNNRSKHVGPLMRFAHSCGRGVTKNEGTHPKVRDSFANDMAPGGSCLQKIESIGIDVTRQWSNRDDIATVFMPALNACLV